LEKTLLKIHEMLNTVYGDNAKKKTAFLMCIKRFCKDCEDCKNNIMTGRPSTTCDNQNIEHVWSHVLSDQRMNVRMLVVMLTTGISYAHIILTKNLRLIK